MEKIASFTVDHEALEPGVYLSRRDVDPRTGAVVSTFDLRMTAPNDEPVMDTAAVHALEHLGATFLRNHPQWADRVVYFGPMGCRTGFYLVLFGDLTSQDVAPLVTDLFLWAEAFQGQVPGASPHDCGNYQDINLSMAQWEARRYLDRALLHIDAEHLTYPGTAPTGV